MRTFTLLIATFLFFQTSHSQEINTQLDELNWLIGTWKGSNKNLRSDGSGVYDTTENLTIKISKIFGGYGHTADWYGPDNSYWGTTIRNFDSQNGKWKEQWFNHLKTTWEDEHLLKWNGNELIMESHNEKDQFGSYSVKRVHKYDSETKTYTYRHHRKYSNMSDWLLIDSFSIKKVDIK